MNLTAASYRRLDSDLVLATATRLRQRVVERFPDSGLAGVAAEVETLGRRARTEAQDIAGPVWPLRIAAGLATVALVGTVGIAVTLLMRQFQLESGLGAILQAIEAAVNEMVFLGLAVFFLASLERRHQRRRALAALHELRSVVHIIDMHQLTKDPEVAGGGHQPTPSSPERPWGRFELTRYLDYCSELLAISSKIAALYVQYLDDPVVLNAVNDIETLATGISGKIWQKIMIIDMTPEPRP